jgi:hypothetical protein
MLVYVRLSDWEDGMGDTGKEELESHVRAALEAHLVEKGSKRRRMMQALGFVSIQMIMFKDIQARVRLWLCLPLALAEGVQGSSLPCLLEIP